jgi:hypothetical protein
LNVLGFLFGLIRRVKNNLDVIPAGGLPALSQIPKEETSKGVAPAVIRSEEAQKAGFEVNRAAILDLSH